MNNKTIFSVIALAAILSLSVFANIAYAASTTIPPDNGENAFKPHVRLERQVKSQQQHTDDADNNNNSNNNNNNNNIDTINNLFRSSSSSSSGGHHKTSSTLDSIPVIPAAEGAVGYNATFYNQTMPYCFAVTTGACYDNSSNSVIP